ncbi:MAG: hypothetical protein OEZ47_17125 [Gammaproteobacteria bacterium]|nr:hypothetical protein [Gammaproteobacteria bacterium]
MKQTLILITVMFGLWAGNAHSADSLVFHGLSYHFSDKTVREKKIIRERRRYSNGVVETTLRTEVHEKTVPYNEENWGLGFEHGNFAVGYFKNSVDRNSAYLAYIVRMGVSWFNVKTGIITGYSSRVQGLFVPTFRFGLYKHLFSEAYLIPEISDVTPTTLGLSLGYRF